MMHVVAGGNTYKHSLGLWGRADGDSFSGILLASNQTEQQDERWCQLAAAVASSSS